MTMDTGNMGKDRRMRQLLMVATLLLLTAGAAAQTAPQLNVVSTAHLDTQWRWTIQQTINEYVPATFRDNFRLIDQFPSYVFSFEGAFKYMLLKEYYLEEYQKLRGYLDSGRWRLAGSWVDAADVNVPSFESLVRQTLYGNGYYKREFGRTSRDIFLPDCFGFGYALPSIAAHCGLKSFSTQKLAWGSWIGIPFDIGIWQGVDGSTIVAGLNPGSYSAELRTDLSRDTTWAKTIEHQREVSGLNAAYRYFGTGDTGGAPDSTSVDWLEKSIHSDGPIRVKSIAPDDLVDLAAAVDTAALPHYNGELVMTRHGVGCYSSQAAMKRWNRKNELLADAAERASVIGYHLGGLTYPGETLRDTWVRFLWHQFHDDLTGTSIPEAYTFSWSDEILSQNRFSAMLEHAVEATASALDTRTKGVPVVVYNSLSIEREDIVEAQVRFDKGAPKNVQVFDPDGHEVPSEIKGVVGNSVQVVFLARVPSVGYAVYDVRPSDKSCGVITGLKVSPQSLENERYTVTMNDAGDITSVYDKIERRELLSAPIQLAFLPDTPNRWPAWEIDFDDIMAEPMTPCRGSAGFQIKELGPARVAVEITRKTDLSVIRTTVRLAAGDARDRVEFDCEIDWYERETLLKASFPLAVANDSATYDLGLGTIKRGLNRPELYEVPAHQWADITAPQGDYGVAILNNCKYGWDHPNPNTLRLTLVRTPGVNSDWSWVEDERSQDNGKHEMLFALQAHKGDWSTGSVCWQAARLNQPLTAYQTINHEGRLGRQFSLLSPDDSTETPSFMVNAVKMAEDSDELVVRVRELAGTGVENATLRFDSPILSAREVNGVEEPVGPATVDSGRLVFSLTPYQPKAFAVTLDKPAAAITQCPTFTSVSLPFNLDGISTDADRCDGDFDGHGNSLAGDLLPDTVVYLGAPFVFGQQTTGALNVVRCEGQTINLPSGSFRKLYLVATAVDGAAQATCSVDRHEFEVSLPYYADPVGQWNSRLVGGSLVETPSEIAPAYINRQPVAWYGSHRHTAKCENEAYRFTYLYLVTLDLPKDAKALILPNDNRVRLLAATLVSSPYDDVVPAQPLYDVTQSTLARISVDSAAFAGRAEINMDSPIPGAAVHYTLDGTEPTETSTRFTEPVQVTTNTTIKARAILAGADNSFVATSTVTRLDLHAPQWAEPVGPGLSCRYYEGDWTELPAFDSLTPVKQVVADTVAIPGIARPEDYALDFRGYVLVPIDGVYSFSVTSDDGSKLYVDDSLLVNNDGVHGDFEMSALIGLKAGYHRLTVDMFQRKGGQALGASIAGPQLPKQSIPASMLFH
jgi:alpha-mannosidase